jgi:hypothetical protein
MLKIKFCVVSHVLLGLSLMFGSCTKDEKLSVPVISLDIPAEGFKVEVGKSLSLNPTIINGDKSTYTWEVNGAIVSSAKLYTFTPSKIGSYNLLLKVSNEIGSDNKTFLISAFSHYSPYITSVFDYKYGPGQHASLIPKDWKGTDFIGQPWIAPKQYTSLGGWGGYIVAGFDHIVKNVEGADFAIFTQPGPSSEPGVVFVMNDDNADGIPNDADWAEIKGSEYTHPETIHDYQVTYYKPVGNGNITWKDNKGNVGELKPVFETASWWWSGYGTNTEIVFTGVRLPNAYKNISTQADIENWVVNPSMFTYGYAECYNNLDYNKSLKANVFDISDAVDKVGNKVNLTGISFIKIQSGVFQVAGWLNEISTEVSGAVDLSLIEYAPN